MRHKETNQRKAAQQLGLRLSSRRTRTRGRQELIPFLAGLRQLVVLIPRPQPSLGYAATGFQTLQHKISYIDLRKYLVISLAFDFQPHRFAAETGA